MNPNQGQPQGQPQQIHISPEDTVGCNCSKCGSEFFIPVYMLRKVSALISPSGREETVQVPVMACANCGTPYQEVPQAEEDGSTIVTK